MSFRYQCELKNILENKNNACFIYNALHQNLENITAELNLKLDSYDLHSFEQQQLFLRKLLDEEKESCEMIVSKFTSLISDYPLSQYRNHDSRYYVYLTSVVLKYIGEVQYFEYPFSIRKLKTENFEAFFEVLFRVLYHVQENVQFKDQHDSYFRQLKWLNSLNQDEVDWLYLYINDKINERSDVFALDKYKTFHSNIINSIDQKQKIQLNHLIFLIDALAGVKDEFYIYSLLNKAKSARSSKKFRDKNNDKLARNYHLSKDVLEMLSSLAKDTHLSQSALLELIIEKAYKGEICIKPESKLFR